MNSREKELLQVIDTVIRKNYIREMLDSMVVGVEKKLAGEDNALMAWEPVPLYLYGEKFPDTILSSWIFILRAGATTGAERHPNSHQRVMSYRGNGDLQVRSKDRWKSNLLVSDLEAELESRWASIPTNVWHQVVVPEKNWAVVSFHTVVAEELIEERPDPIDESLTHRRLYLDKN